MEISTLIAVSGFIVGIVTKVVLDRVGVAITDKDHADRISELEKDVAANTLAQDKDRDFNTAQRHKMREDMRLMSEAIARLEGGRDKHQ